MPTWLRAPIDAAARWWARVSVPSYWAQRVSEGWHGLASFAKNRAFRWARIAQKWMEQGR